MVIGHQKIRQILQNQVKNDEVHHAYLFWGPEGIGKKLVALEFAKMLLCPAGRDGKFCGLCDSCRLMAAGAHPDFQFIEPEIEETEKFSRIKEIGITRVRRLIGFQNLKSILSSRKVFIINDARYLTGEAQNALLKSLEEPSGRSIFVLIASDQADFFETIRSRCQKIKFSSLDFDDFKKIIESSGLPSERLKEFYFLFGGRPGPALKFAASEGQKNLDRLRSEFLKIFKKDLWERYRLSEDLVKDEKNFLQTLDFWRLLIRDLILAKIEAGDILINQSLKEVIAREAKNHEIEKLLRISRIFGRLVLAVKTTNLNSRLALDWALTEI